MSLSGFPAQLTPENLDQTVAQYAERADRAGEVSDRILAIRAVGRSDRGLAEVTVDGSALVTDLRFSPGAPSSFLTLGTAMKQAHDRAVAEWNRQVLAITDELLHDDPTLRQHIQTRSNADLAAHVNPDHLEPQPEA